MIGNSKKIKEFGDFQTPMVLVNKICRYIKESFDYSPDVIIEPTFGTGNFILGCINSFPNLRQIMGIEINPCYFRKTNTSLREHLLEKNKNISINLYNDNFFDFNLELLKNKIKNTSKLLIVGNPPWITNSELGKIQSINLPEKSNLKNHKGLDALTGKGNFDISEHVILKLLREFSEYDLVLAMLCKNSVTKNIFKLMMQLSLNISDIRMLSIDAKENFDVNCDASLLVLKTGDTKTQECDVYSLDSVSKKVKTIGWVNNNFVSNLGEYSDFSFLLDGLSPYEWRQGMKHDCSKIMELSTLQHDGTYYNGDNDVVDIEDDFVYPLLKSSDLKKYIITEITRNVIVPQKKINDRTDKIEALSPRLFQYLSRNESSFRKRKSSIYKNAPIFSVFGIGDYSFKKYKVAVSGFYKEPIFCLCYSNKSFMIDDTCYAIGFDEYSEALITMILLNSDYAIRFIKSIAFLDAKRPFTKDILMRVDLTKLAKKYTFDDLVSEIINKKIPVNVTKEDFAQYKNNILCRSLF